METGFAVTGFLGVILNLLVPQEVDDEDDIEVVDEEMQVFHEEHPHPVLEAIHSLSPFTSKLSKADGVDEGVVVSDEIVNEGSSAEKKPEYKY